MKRALYSALILTNLSLNLGGFFIPTAHAAPGVTVTPATGGSAISADTNAVNGTANWTTLTGPVFTEGGVGDIGVGTIILNAPAGFIFAEDLPAPTVLLSGNANASRNINDLANGSAIPVTQSVNQLTIAITAATSNGVKNTLTWQNIRVRPSAGNPLASGNITSSGTSNINGVTSNSTNLGTLAEAAGALNRIAVTPSNSRNISIGETVSFSAEGFDANNNPLSGLTYAWAVTPDTGSGSITAGGMLTSTGSGTLTVTATSGAVTGTSGIVTVNTNNVPTVGNQSVSTDENTTLAISLSGSDLNGDTLSYSIISSPNHGTLSNLNSASGTVNYIPTTNYNGSDSFTFKVNDGIVDGLAGTVSITINAVNSAPVIAGIGNKTVDENVNLSFVISATDPENNPITYSATNTPAGSTFNTNTQTFRWKPSYNQAGTYTNVRFTATDGSSPSSEDITITVNNVNRAPVLDPVGNKTGAENSELTFALTAADPDNNTMIFSGVGLPSGASVSSTTGTFSWTPDYSQSGISTSTMRVCDTDPSSLCDEEIITFTISNTNRAPALDSIGAKNASENFLSEFAITATDPDGDAVSYSASNLPEGAIFATSTGTFSWTPSYSQAGNFPSVHFEAGDGSATSTEDVTIAVANTNRTPLLNPIGDKSGKENSALTFTVTGTDPDGDTLTYSASNLPSGAAMDPATGIFSWKPGFNQEGNHPAIHITISDGSASANEDIAIMIENVSQDGGGAIIGAIGGIIGNLSLFNFGPAPETPKPVLPALIPSAEENTALAESQNLNQPESAVSNPSSAAGRNPEIAAGQPAGNEIIEPSAEQPGTEISANQTNEPRTSLLANLADLMSSGNFKAMLTSAAHAVSQSVDFLFSFFTALFSIK